MAEIIRDDKKDTSLLETTLECLGYVLHLGAQFKNENKNPFVQDLFAENLVPRLEELQYHDSDKVYEKVSYILSSFFDLEESFKLE